MLRAAGVARRPSRPSSVSVDPAERLSLGDGRRARRLLVGGAVHRRRDARAGVAASRSTTSASTRAAPACSTCSSGWARASASSTRRRIGAEPVGDIEVRSAELTATTIERRGGAAARRRAAALRRCSPPVAHGDELGLRRRASCALKETDRIEAVVDALRAIGGRAEAHDGRLLGHAACRPGRAAARVDARGDHRIAMLGRGRRRLRRARACEVEGAESVAISFPGFYELARRESSQQMIVAIDGPAGAGKSTVARRLAERLGFRYLDTGRDVPRADLARAARGAAARRRASRSASSRARTRSPSTRSAASSSPAPTSPRRSASRGSTGWSRSSRATTRCAR